MKDNSDIDYKRRTHYIIIALLGIAVLWLNYCSLRAHVSSNSRLITDYQPKEDELARYRNPAVAGIFYSADKDRLDSEVEHYLADTASPLDYQPRILIVPHAGYVYSASTAAKAYGRLQKYAAKIKNVILLGPSHRVAFRGAALPSANFFATPLGAVPVNRELTAQLAALPGFKIDDHPHKEEHSLEVQLPFLQKVLKKFKIIPVVYGEVDPGLLAQALEPLVERDDTLLVVSADLSHYNDYETARELDGHTADMVANNQAELENHMSCGADGINAALLIAKEAALRPEMLELLNSGDTSGDKQRVVGYGAWSFGEGEKPASKPKLSPLERETENLKLFAAAYKDQLRRIVSRSLAEAVRHKHYSPARKDYGNELFDKGASFVTLKQNGELRGCVGTVVPHVAVAHDLAENAYRAAMEDGRFSPLTEEELSRTRFSISLLTGFERVPYWDESDLLNRIRPGIDGLIIRDGDRQGLFLPSVWKELPDKAEFLKNLKVKAGFNPSYWSNNIKVYRFRTVEINDED